jgi:integrase
VYWHPGKLTVQMTAGLNTVNSRYRQLKHMPLTDLSVRTAKPKEKPYKLSDGGGLYLLVRADGARYWRMDYRWLGKRRTLAFGVYDTVCLAEAREKRNVAKRQLAAGQDPSEQRKLDKIALVLANANTFRAVADEWTEKLGREGRSDSTLSKIRWMLDLVEPIIGNRPIAEIRPPEVLEALRRVEARGRYETARRLRSVCSRVFRYAIRTSRATIDPSASLLDALTVPKVKHRSAITEPIALGALLRAIENYDGHFATQAALRLAPLFFVRPGELRNAEWNEFDLNVGEWKIPASKMKMKLPHRVPLARQAVSILRNLRQITGEGRYLFPSVRSSARPISDNTLNAALRRLGYSKDEMTAHGFRSTAAVRLNETGRWNSDAIERQLAHQEPNSVRRAYTHAAEYWTERCEMMQAWADQLENWRNGVLVEAQFPGRKADTAK